MYGGRLGHDEQAVFAELREIVDEVGESALQNSEPLPLRPADRGLACKVGHRTVSRKERV